MRWTRCCNSIGAFLIVPFQVRGMTCVVYFNLDGTLTEHDYDYPAIYQAATEAAGLELDDAYEEYTNTFFNYFQNGWAYPRRQAMLDIMRERAIADTGKTDAFAEAWEEEEAEATTFRDGATELVQALGERHTVGIVTNGTGGLQRAKLEQAGLTAHLDSIVVSSEIGVPKPNKDFFAAAEAAVEADTYIVVSDDLKRDILPAKRAGFQTVWLAAQEPEQDVSQVVDRRVSSLDAVEDAVDELCG